MLVEDDPLHERCFAPKWRQVSQTSDKVPQASVRDPEKVRAMFGRIAHKYDLANHVLSLGSDFFWRARVAGIVEIWQARRILDLATGSGDLALAMQQKLPDAEITAADFSPEMLALASSKGVKNTILADALALPFSDASFDCVTVGFGLRNMADWSAALREMSRVIHSNGHLLILDFSLPSPPLRFVYRAYLHKVLPHVAALLTGQRDAYDYLGGSIEAFPIGDEMLRLIESCGFRNASAYPVTAGVATIYVAERSTEPTPRL